MNLWVDAVFHFQEESEDLGVSITLSGGSVTTNNR